ncbi:SDR family oxidoreductase [Xanthomarina sp. F1114]|uniref:SDR family oxidoreductase n=1 Tax=Xanthomarina sp. F1114 TaxID=2996019 RepID=UPI00225DF210|nr:SDR family oxidoreductase [Xanthomarina sp. F1114]MCX7547005.1 SDR family oxidoreductase [Xanthomarina sp. F1114]
MILVTGGTGLVGSHLLLELALKNKAIKAIYRDEKKLTTVKKIFSYYNKNSEELFNKIEWVQADLLDIPLLIDAFKNVKYVYHCAALVSFEPNKYHELRKTNIEGTANIVNLCASSQVEKLCYVSSIATLGKTLDNTDVDEDTIWNPESDNSLYGITKYGAEMEVWRGIQEGLNAVIVNPGVILAPGIWNYGSGHIFKKVYNGLAYYTEGTTGYIDVFDVVNSMIQLMESSTKNERFVLVAENQSYKNFIIEVANSLQVKRPTKKAKVFLLSIAWRMDWLKSKLTGERRILSKQLANTLVTSTTYSSDKIKTLLDIQFKPVNKSIEEVSKKFLKEH